MNKRDITNECFNINWFDPDIAQMEIWILIGTESECRSKLLNLVPNITLDNSDLNKRMKVGGVIHNYSSRRFNDKYPRVIIEVFTDQSDNIEEVLDHEFRHLDTRLRNNLNVIPDGDETYVRYFNSIRWNRLRSAWDYCRKFNNQ